MKTGIKNLFLPPLLMLMPPGMLRADDYIYTTNNGTITITGYPGLGGAVSIPNTITGLPVTSIGDSAFSVWWGGTNLTSVTIPNSVTNIGSYAFKNCSPTSVAIPDSVTHIGDLAFMYCQRLTSVTIPNSTTTIGDNAFSYCTSLTNVTIGNGMTSIGSLFDHCFELANVTIGNSITNIGDGAFGDCGSLTEVFFRGDAPSRSLKKAPFFAKRICHGFWIQKAV